jgi:hypothetical protein
MPRVPGYDNFQTSVATQPNAQFQGPSGPQAGAIAAEQQGQMGKALSSAGDAMVKIALAEAEKADTIRVEDAANQLDKIKVDRQIQALSLTGRAALERPDNKSLMDEESEALAKASDEITKGLGNDNQRAVFSRYAGRLTNQYRGQLGSHVLQQSKQFEADSAADKANTAYKTAGMLYADPLEVANARAKIQGVIDQTISMKGLDRTKDKEMISEIHSKLLTPLHTAVLDGFMTKSKDPLAAKAYYEQHSTEMSLQAKANFNDAITQSVAELKGTGKTQELVAAAGDGWSLKEIDGKLAEQFKNSPTELKFARSELKYQAALRDDAKRELENKQYGPVNILLGDALNAGKSIGKQDREKVLAPLRTSSPEAYAKAANLIDKHNDEIRREGHEAQSRARSLAESSPEKALNYIGLKMDMVRNPDKYRSADMQSVLREPVINGKLSPAQATSLTDLWVQLRKPEKQKEFATMLTADDHLDMRLAGTVVDGTQYSKLSKEKKEEIKNKARSIVEPLLAAYQAQTGDKADKKEIQGVIDSIFTNKTYRSTFLGASYGKQFTEQTIDAEGAPARLDAVATTAAVGQIPPAMRSRIASAIKASGGVPSDALILEYYNRRPQ